MRPPPTPWPRLTEAWWVYALGIGTALLYPAALVVRLRCSLLDRCGGPVQALDPEAVGGVPRLYVTALFAGTAVLACLAARRAEGEARMWWRAIAGIGILLALAKLVSAHSMATTASSWVTLLGGLLVSALVIGTLAAAGRRWGVAGAGTVLTALSALAVTALGLEVATTVLAGLQNYAGALNDAWAVFLEEFGEALTALWVLVAVRWSLPAAAESPSAVLGGGARSGAQDPRT